MNKINTLHSLTLLVTLAAVMAAAGCAAPAAPDAALPTAPAQWRFAPQDRAGADPVSAAWWESIGNAELDALVRRARADNPSIAAAYARVQQARASVVIARAPLLPALTGSADAQHDGSSGVSSSDSTANLRLGLAASYEFDLWGGNRGAAGSAAASLRAAGFAQDAATLSVTAEVALAWLQTVSLRERIGIATRMLENARSVLAVVDARQRAGSATALELAQQRGLVASRERTLRLLAQRANDSLVALAILLGQSASGLEVETASLASLRQPAIDSGLPAALLTRRPDLAAAEARLAAADGNIALARALMLPRLALTANATVESDHLRTLFENPVYSLAAGVLAPIFNAGKLAAGHDLAIAQKQELLADYRRAIVAASGDVEVALNTMAGVNAQRIAQDEELAQARHAFALAQRRYRAGAQTLLSVLDTQRTLYSAEDDAAQLRLAGLQGAVLLYKALGGGWQPDA
ncbi:efflux transporter outer membrane subunit [Cupriavidus basilensis]|uniref:RND efflux system, outer membrane lipoprotein CmeC n=1 Tax=Cupriavidus basilensis TaxID=68895 RepID=A0A0C4YNT8_9BURK|nr:efflux transporter outer membrane subunit [Cupriavidus basilensis]AJG23744.1 RND efflux system, outer membrane lipoprotein CmeC [Cupriavidus basilensis]